jgi:hypothetical protein
MGDVLALDTGALFSPDRLYRYLLWRSWDRDKPICAFVGLNPSTADEVDNDPTIRRCIGFAKSWGYGSLWMLNAYAWRSTDPRALRTQGADAIGPNNDLYLRQAALNCGLVVAAWGVHCDDVRERTVARVFEAEGKPLHVLGLSKAGKPRHPLRLRADLEPRRWALFAGAADGL